MKNAFARVRALNSRLRPEGQAMNDGPINKTMLLRNVLRVKPNATPDQVRAIVPALADVPDAELRDWMSQARRANARLPGAAR